MNKLTDQQIEKFVADFPSAGRDVSMAGKTFLKIGGPARIFLTAEKNEDLVRAVKVAKQNEIPWYIMGGGSNLLVSDDGFEGVVIQMADRSVSIDGTKAIAFAGCFTGLLARDLAKRGLVGFEWGVGVPGTIGGAVYGNAGCFGGEMKDAIVSVETYDLTEDAIVTYKKDECGFSYRESRFKREPHIILKTELELNMGDASASLKKIDEIMAKRKDSQPQGAFSAGCLFKNFTYEDEGALEILRRKIENVPPEMLKNKKLGAGWLIDMLGLKGTQIGKAQISPVHGNFLLNLGGARAQDVLGLSSLVKMRVRDELGIMLEDEVQLLGF